MKVLISLSETLPLEEIQKEIRKINYEKKEIEDKLHNYKKNKETIKELDKDKDLKELWNLLTFIEKRTIIDLLIDKVIIKKTKLEIYWNLY